MTKDKRNGQDKNSKGWTGRKHNLLERETTPSFDELVRPIHEQTERLGLTERDVEEMVDTELADLRREKPLASQ